MSVRFYECWDNYMKNVLRSFKPSLYLEKQNGKIILSINSESGWLFRDDLNWLEEGCSVLITTDVEPFLRNIKIIDA